MTLIQLSKASSTRLLSYEKAVSSFLQAYSSLLESLRVEENDRKCSKAHGFLEVIAEWCFLCLINMLHLVLPRLSALSKPFQVKNVYGTRVIQIP